jgi:hypothetical protein
MIRAHFNPNAPYGTAVGYLVFGLLVLASASLLATSLRTPRRQAQPFQPSGVMDFLAFGSVILFLILGTFFASGPTIVTSQPLNKVAVTIENVWTILCALVFFLVRWMRRSDIQV